MPLPATKTIITTTTKPAVNENETKRDKCIFIGFFLI